MKKKSLEEQRGVRPKDTRVLETARQVALNDCLQRLITLRKDVDAKTRFHRLDKPADSQGFMSLRARKNGIQSCINQVVLLQKNRVL